jgi:hypothetical protein
VQSSSPPALAGTVHVIGSIPASLTTFNAPEENETNLDMDAIEVKHVLKAIVEPRDTTGPPWIWIKVIGPGLNMGVFDGVGLRLAVVVGMVVRVAVGAGIVDENVAVGAGVFVLVGVEVNVGEDVNVGDDVNVAVGVPVPTAA